MVGSSANPSVAEAILSNAIFSNARPGIDLDVDGPTPNDPLDADAGPNGLQNFPVLTRITRAGGSTTIEGTLLSRPGTTFTLQFFSDHGGGPGTLREGQVVLGSGTATTDARAGRLLGHAAGGRPRRSVDRRDGDRPGRGHLRVLARDDATGRPRPVGDAAGRPGPRRPGPRVHCDGD